MLILSLLIFTAVIITALAFIVGFSGLSKRLNLYLFLFLFFVGLWTLGTVLLFYSQQLSIISLGVMLFYVSPMLTTYFILLFAESSPDNKKVPLSKLIVYTIPAVLLGGYVIYDPDFLVNKIHIMDTGRNIIIPNPIPYLIYASYFATYFVGVYWIFINKVFHAEGIERNQLLYSTVGIIISSVLAMTTNLVFPLMGIYAFWWLGPLFALFYATLATIAIVRHRYLDIRILAARSVAYMLLLTTLGLLYGLGIFTLSNTFLESSSLGVAARSMYTILAVFLAFTFQPLKRFFDKITNKIFYRDVYDTQTVLKQIGEVLASEIDLNTILSQTLDTLQDSLKFTHGRFLVMAESELYKQAETEQAPTHHPEISDLTELENDIVITDEIKGDRKQLLHEHDIAVVLKLKTQYSVEGYLLLGMKQSGAIYTNQDIQLLNTVSSELAVGIQNAKAYEEIQQFNITLQKRIEAATKELRENNEKLKELDQAKDEFISMASHQLRTPLTTIKGYLSMMLEGDVGKLSKKQQEFVNLAFVRSQRMVYLISDMLNVSRISTGKLTFDKKEFDLAEVVKGEVEQLQRQAEEHEVGLTLHSPEEKSIPITLDEGKIRQVVMNFIDNAIYYAPKGKVDVYLDKKDDFVEFRVVDDGIGVSKDVQEQLFTKFFRAENARHVRPDGTGLGLYMAKQVIEAQNGEIIFQSEEGKGSTFGFRFSLKE